MRDRESESDIKFGVTPISNVLKIEHRRFWAFALSKKLILSGIRVNEGRGIRI